MDTTFCIDVLEKALDVSTPTIFNTDQGAQFTSLLFTKVLLDKDIKISMDGRGRALAQYFCRAMMANSKI